MVDIDKFLLKCLSEDRETYDVLGRKIYEMIEYCQKVRANPLTIYLVSFSLSGFAGEMVDRLALEIGMDSNELKDACVKFYGTCMDDIDSMSEAERIKSIKSWRRENKTTNYIG